MGNTTRAFPEGILGPKRDDTLEKTVKEWAANRSPKAVVGEAQEEAALVSARQASIDEERAKAKAAAAIYPFRRVG